MSDVVIYKTDAGRVHADMFTFLSESSLAFHKHFTNELKRVIERSKVDMAVNTVAPAAVVFHETRRTDTLGDSFSGASEVSQCCSVWRACVRVCGCILATQEKGL